MEKSVHAGPRKLERNLRIGINSNHQEIRSTILITLADLLRELTPHIECQVDNGRLI